MKMNETQVNENLQVISTGSLGLDLALGVGGLPRGRVVEISGPESSGKPRCVCRVVARRKAGRHLRLYRRRKTRWICNTPASWAWM